MIVQLAAEFSDNDTGMGIGILMLILAALFFWDSGKK